MRWKDACEAMNHTTSQTPVLRVRGLVKQFPGVRALDGVDFELLPGEAHAILGENGAGKSTLMNVLYGLLRPDEGSLELWGRPYAPTSPREAVLAGIGMVHQHFMLIPALTVVENVALGAEPRRGLVIDLDAAAERLTRLSETYHLGVDPRAKVGDLSVGMRQRVEILKAFYREARLLILDEPTALLTPQESRELFSAIREFRDRGLSVIFISHKLDEVREVAARVTVVRRGKTIGTRDIGDVTSLELARMMVGHDVVMAKNPGGELGEKVILEIRDLSTAGLTPTSLELREGEILGVAGVEGNGQEELIGALTGLLPSTGEVVLEGRPIGGLSVRKRVEAGLGLVPSDRQEEGLVLGMSVAENLALRRYYRPPYGHGGLLNVKYWIKSAEELVRSYDVRPPLTKATAGSLSGGNQQKVVLAREISADPKVLIASQPTRGLDVGATEFVHQGLLNLRNGGRGVLLVSLDLDEILALSDRIAVFYKGRLMQIMSRESADRDTLGLLMMGVEPGVKA